MLQVAEEINMPESICKFEFTDGSFVTVKEIHQPVYFKKVSGDFNKEQIKALEKYSLLKVKD